MPTGERGDALQAAHIISRNYYATRFDLDNGLALCQRCHKRWTMQPVEWFLTVVETIGLSAYVDLCHRALVRRALDYVALIEKLSALLDSE